jgi:hypothetical protein
LNVMTYYPILAGQKMGSNTWFVINSATGLYADDAAKDDFAAYFALNVINPYARKIRLALQNQLGLTVWLNGVSKYQNATGDNNAKIFTPVFALGADTSTFVFKLTAAKGANRFSVQIQDSVGGSIKDLYSFLTDANEKPITILSPKSGDQFYIGDTMRVLWTVGSGIALQAKFDISINGGRNWTALPGITKQVVKGDPWWLNLPWVIPDVLSVGSQETSSVSPNCKFRISGYNGGFSTVSGVFSICAKGQPCTPPIAVRHKRGFTSGSPYRLSLQPDGKLSASIWSEKPQAVTLTVFDALGHQIATAGNGAIVSGNRTFSLQVGKGIYFVKIMMGSKSYMQRLPLR